ncbi:MAG: FtsQ-type POTRA domain-containing protein [Bdellovibrionaceae bacterium]|nr:FtsQ-type POTRA domain-containing protein [Pseudobdellovibrionaceae bacterium]
MEKLRKTLITTFSVICIIFSTLLLFSFSKIKTIELKPDLKTQNQISYKKSYLKISTYLNNYKGKYLWDIHLKELAEKIKSIYLEAEVQVQRKFPNRLIVLFKEKVTFLLLLKQNNFFYSVSQEGHIGEKKGGKDSLNFPILIGKAFEKNLQLRQRAISILAKLNKEEGSFSVRNISEILYNKNNDSFLFYLVSDHFILELKTSPSLKKISNVDFVINYLRKQNRIKALIDARMEKKIIVKKIN